VDFGPVALSALTEDSSGLLCGPWASDPAFTPAKAAASAGATAASEASAAIGGFEEALSAAEAAAALAVKECECKVYTDYTAAFAAATAASKGHEASYTKGKHMKCVLAGTSPDACEVGTVPTVSPVTLAAGASADACTPEDTTAGPFWAEDACTTEGDWGTLKDLGPQCFATDSGHTATVRCCAKDGGTCYSKGSSGCFGKAETYANAHAICESDGYRLCTKAEVDSQMCCRTGCMYDHERVWTSTKCS